MQDVIKGKYRIVREIARSNDIVYEAVDTTLDRRIALKELNIAPGLTGQARRERVERFNREARAAGRLSHPNIVSVFDFGEENGRHFIAMEYLEGQNLRDVLQQRGVLPQREALDIAQAVLSALAFAHANKVIHRDIKPDNIQILPGGQVKLTDFGIARLTEEPALTSNGQVFGTPSYMSPEQIEGRGIDYRSDLFSVGVVLYEMLAGHKPFVGDSVISITYAIMNAEPAPLSGIPSGIEQTIRRALAKNPNNRPPSADAMKRDLQSAEQTPAVFASASNSPTGMGRTGMGQAFLPSGQSGLPPLYGSAPPSAYGNGSPPMQNNGPVTYGNMVPGSYAPAPNAGYAPLPAPQNANGANAPQGAPGGLNWAFNTPGGRNAPSSPPAPGNANQPGQPAPNPYYPYAAPPFARPPGPLFTISPGGRAFLLSVAVAILLGGGIAAGVIAFQRSYDRYSSVAKTQQVAALINQGVTAYNARDYASAARFFELAQSGQPNAKERATIAFNLTAAYVQLARLAEANQRWDEAREWYQKALAISPDDRNAHLGLAAALEHLGDANGARAQRGDAPPADSHQDTPATLELNPRANDPYNPNNPDSAQTSKPADPQAFLNDRRARAQALLDEGDQLAKQNDLEGARQKWREAISAAPATPERDQAQERLDRSQPAPKFDE